jgi:short subunit dehydrogenase-like uncharacterized protein
MERMQLLYNEEASQKGVYVVPACGLDSIPADMGVDFTRRTFKGTLNSVEVYQEVVSDTDGYGTGSVTNSGTWESLVYIMADYSELKKIRTKLFLKRLPDLQPKLSYRYLTKTSTSNCASICLVLDGSPTGSPCRKASQGRTPAAKAP